GETFSDVYWSQGRYVPESLSRIDQLMRDQRGGAVTSIDPRLLDVIEGVQRRTDPGRPLEVVSGYRTPESNRLLRRAGVHAARHSFHTQGMAVDVRAPDHDQRALYRVARSLRGGGVGYYPRGNFVHLDVGVVRWWTASA